MSLNRKEKTVWQLFAVAAKARHHINRILGRYDMSTTSYLLLRAVAGAEEGPMSIRELAKVSGVPCVDTTRLLDRMEQYGWIYRTRDGLDRRIVLVRATDDGRSALSEVDELVKGACEEITKYFDEADMVGLSEHFRNIVDAVEECHA
jgi:DNA-binding MarR family transcriptional regulator